MAGEEPVEGGYNPPVFTDNPYKSRSGEGEGLKDDSRKDRSDDRDRSRKDRHRERSRERSPREHDRDRDKDRARKGSKDREKDKGKDRERKSRRHRSRSKERDRSPREKRKRPPRQSGFDMPPAIGFTGAPEAGGSLMPPGATAQDIALASLSFPGMPLAANRPQAMTQQATRHARRVYVGGLPPLANEQTVARFFSQALAAVGGTSHIAAGNDSVVNVYINAEKKFAFVEFRTVEETSNAMALDGIMFEGVSVRVRRPNDYNPAMAATLGPATPSQSLNLAAIGLVPGMAGGAGQNTADGPDRIFVGGLPYYLPEDQIRDLLGQFGLLKGFDLVKDRETGNSKGYGFAVYEDTAVVDLACAGLNGLAMGDKTLTVRRATAAGQAKPDTADVIQQAQNQIAMSMAMQSGGLPFMQGPPPTRVVSLLDVVDVAELTDDVAFTEIMEDMQDECGKYGTVLKLLIPRPQPDGSYAAGVGKVYVEYEAVDGAVKARAALNGRKFAGKAVKAEFCDEARFAEGELE